MPDTTQPTASFVAELLEQELEAAAVRLKEINQHIGRTRDDLSSLEAEAQTEIDAIAQIQAARTILDKANRQ